MKKKPKKSKKGGKKTEKTPKLREPGGNQSTAPASAIWDNASLKALIEELREICDDIQAIDEKSRDLVKQLHPSHRGGGRNLIHYLTLRRHDIRAMQEKLAAVGLSSLGRSESHVLSSLISVLKILHHLAAYPQLEACVDFLPHADGRKMLDRNADELLGPKPAQRCVRIMVTMPSEAAEDYYLVRDLLAAGMDCMRINCAHDNTEVWRRMIENLKRARQEVSRKCKVLMDLGGPKLRTGPVEPEVPVIKWRPKRDQFGKILAPARIWLKPEGSDEQPDVEADTTLTLKADWLEKLKTGDTIRFVDAREAKRKLDIVSEVGGCRWAEAAKTAYVTAETVFHRSSGSGKRKSGKDGCTAGIFKSTDSFILLKKGDILVLTKELEPGKNAQHDKSGGLLSPAFIGCTLPEVFDSVRTGERIWLDDGKIGGVIKSAGKDRIKVKITNARPCGEKLRGEKGINLPDTKLKLSALSQKDKEDLRFVAKNAHMVGMSFAQETNDVLELQAALKELKKPDLGIVLKIETRRGFEMMPDLLLTAMRSPVAGVMIARGDLAVECGYERLAEAQEEMLWICEAAHMPVIWATQVLETLAKTGIPSRAEITDAAMGERAECVMLNKGPHILDAIRVLDNILQRMEAHQSKKSAMLRRLHWWGTPDKHLK